MLDRSFGRSFSQRHQELNSKIFLRFPDKLRHEQKTVKPNDSARDSWVRSAAESATLWAQQEVDPEEHFLEKKAAGGDFGPRLGLAWLGWPFYSKKGAKSEEVAGGRFWKRVVGDWGYNET